MNDQRQAAEAAYEAWQKARGVPGGGTWHALPEDAKRRWVTTVEAAAPHLAAAEREHIRQHALAVIERSLEAGFDATALSQFADDLAHDRLGAQP